MGVPEGRAMLSDFIPNGLLPNEAASVTRVLDPDRWSHAEERTAELIAHIQPNQPSEERRNAVASYVQRLIMKCFSCQVFTFGSVPLKTYLPDGDIDLTAFSSNQDFKDSWAHEVQYVLESEEKSEDAEFRVKEVQLINAEVKIIKCLVDNIVVDISFNQLGGLCTLCFLEEVDNLISQNHLFKRSIILIKTWCYYESRILGAHHGLISTYALETLVLYIFHVYNNTFAGPLEVLYRFLEFFSKFDWDNYCLSLWGPVPLGLLPNLRAEPPRKDCGELLLSKFFLDVSTSVYAVIPGGQENQEQPFVSKYFNIIDPLRANNNLGRSVSKGNFFRIRSAFAFGARRLVRLVDCPEENLIAEFDLFFRNTWDRHGKGHWPDAPSYDLYEWNKKVTENSTCHESEADQAQAFHASHAVYQQHANHLKESKQMFRTSDVSAVSQSQSQKTDGIFAGSVTSGTKHTNSVKNALTDGDQSPNYSSNEVHAICHSVGAHSSQELTHTSGEVAPQHSIDESSETERGQSHSDSLITDSSKRSSLRSKVLDNQNDRVSAENQQSLWQTSYDWRKDDAVNSQNALNGYNSEFDLALIKEDGHSSDNAILMHQEELDSLNNAETYRNHIFNGYLQAPVSVNSDHLSFPVPLPILASGYTHANSFDMLPANVPSLESFWGYHKPYSQSLVPFPASQSFLNVGMTSNLEEITKPVDDNLLAADLDHDDQDEGFWSEQHMNSVRGYIYEDGNIKSQQQRHRQMAATAGSSSGNDHTATIGNIWLTRENCGDDPPDETTIYSEVNSTASSRSTPALLSTSRNELSSCSSLKGSLIKASKLTRDREIKTMCPTPPYSINEGQYEGKQGDHFSSQLDNVSGEWICKSTVDTFLVKSTSSETVTSDVHSHQSTNYKLQPMTVSNSTVPDTSIFLGPCSSQGAGDNEGLLPFAFYQDGPPFQFLNMVSLCNRLADGGAYTASSPVYMDAELGNLHEHQSSVSLDTTSRFKNSDTFNKFNRIRHGATLESFEKQRSDIFKGDFACHWQNLQYGRLCQNAQLQGPLPYSPSFVKQLYLQRQCPWDVSGIPLANMNVMGSGSQLVPLVPTQRGFDSHVGIGQHFADELPRYSGGTGTYLPNPRFYRNRHYSNTRNQRENYSYNRKDHQVEREWNWNFNSKPRFAGRGQFRYQVERPGTRMDKTNPGNRRSDQSWNSFKHGSFSSYNSHNGSFNSSMSNNHVTANVPYGMHPFPIVSAGEISPSGYVLPSIYMMYPYDHNVGYDSNNWPEFGYLGKAHLSGKNESSHQGEEDSPSAVNELANFERDSSESSPDQPLSPNFHRVLQD